MTWWSLDSPEWTVIGELDGRLVTTLIDAGSVEIDVPRDSDRRGVDEMVIS